MTKAQSRLLKMIVKEYNHYNGFSIKSVMKRYNYSRTTVSNLIRLLRTNKKIVIRYYWGNSVFYNFNKEYICCKLKKL